MKTVTFKQSIAAGVLTLALGATVGNAAPATGETSGPAAGKPTVPSTATQNQGSKQDNSAAAGAPGVPGKPGGESGGTQTKNSGQPASH